MTDQDNVIYDVAELLKVKTGRGLAITAEIGTMAPPYVIVEGSKALDERIWIYGNINDTWTIDRYASLEAFQQGINPLVTETTLPSSEDDPELIANAFIDALTDVCITGNPAWDGRCDDADCPCQPATHRVVTEEELANERAALSPAERDELGHLDDDPMRDHRERNICEGCGEYNVNCTCEDSNGN